MTKREKKIKREIKKILEENIKTFGFSSETTDALYKYIDKRERKAYSNGVNSCFNCLESGEALAKE